MIPKIIHQTAPSDKSRWHPIWEECQSSWIKNHPDFKYILWNDYDLRNLIKNNYNRYLNLYDSIPVKIVKIDFARFIILHNFGGIYADMDMFCYKNFYKMLKNDIYIVESWEEWGEKIQNSLMISKKNHKFWEKCIELSSRMIQQKGVFYESNSILETCGPRFLSKIMENEIETLPKEFFNPKIKTQFNWSGFNYDCENYKNAISDFKRLNSEESEIITRHYLTGRWGI